MERKNLYDRITDAIVRDLENGVAPWARPWGTAHTGAARLPANMQSGNEYSGINILLLWGSAIENGYSDQRWMTYKQAQALGGNVRKGEKGTPIVYVGRFTPQQERERAAADGDKARDVAFLKSYSVFNVDQVDGIDRGDIAAPMPERQQIERAERLIKATGADFRIGGDRAFYVPSQDFIQVPPQPAFFEQINYYRTAFHELGHWTGHRSRLDRNMTTRPSEPSYAREELVAEMCAAFVCASLDIAPTVRHADYIGSWLQVLREDNRAIVQAASAASKAANFILAADEASTTARAA